MNEYSVARIGELATENQQLREQLAAAHKQYEELAVASVDKIGALVDALTDIADRNTHEDAAAGRIARAALAKVPK